MKVIKTVSSCILLIILLGFYSQSATAQQTRGYYSAVLREVQKDFPPYAVSSAMHIIRCETGGTYYPGAYNPVPRGDNDPSHHARGIAQVITRYHPWVNVNRIYELSYGVKIFAIISEHGTNWQPWIVGGCNP